MTIDNIAFKSILCEREKLDLVKKQLFFPVVCHLNRKKENQRIDLKVIVENLSFICGLFTILKLILFLS